MEMAGFRFDGMNLLDMFCEALVIWEASTGAVLYTNESARALYGYSCGEASALSIDDIFPDWEGGLRKGSFSIRTATHRKKDGMFFPVQLTCRSLPGNAGDVMMMVASDVSPENLIHDSVSLAASIQRGFLPGDLQSKVDPYLRPLYDTLQEFLGLESYKALYERGAIEVAPLAYMRGRTLNNAYIILDEAQNCSTEQMKMFLTRIGEGSRVVVTGDVTQIDLPKEKASGLVQAVRVLENVEGIKIINLTHKDVVRHELVQRIICAYERFEKPKRA